MNIIIKNHNKITQKLKQYYIIKIKMKFINNKILIKKAILLIKL
jgi:hypothetical protein